MYSMLSPSCVLHDALWIYGSLKVSLRGWQLCFTDWRVVYWKLHLASFQVSKLHSLQSWLEPDVSVEVCECTEHTNTLTCTRRVLNNSSSAGPLVIGRSSRGNTKPFSRRQTELSVNLQWDNTAIQALKIAAPHLWPFEGHAVSRMVRAAAEPGHINLRGMW